MVRPRGNAWQADIRDATGARHRPTFRTALEAEAWELEARRAVAADRPLPKAPGKGRNKGRGLSKLGSLLDHLTRTEWAMRRSGSTLIRSGQRVCEYFGRDKHAYQITSADIDEYKSSVVRSGRTPATANRRVAALSKMLTLALEEGSIAHKPKIRWFTEEQTRFRYLDADEELRLLGYWIAAEDRDLYDLTVMLLDTGARCWSEMVPVKWKDFGEEFRTVTFWRTKTNRPRTIPLTARCRKLLETRKARFGDADGPFRCLTKAAVVGRWQGMRQTIKFFDVTPHTLRHTCCTRLVLGGMDVKTVMTWMGHSAMVTTLRYMQLRPDGLEAALPILERLAVSGQTPHYRSNQRLGFRT